MRTLLEKAHDVSSIGTFVLTIVVVALMVIPMLWPSSGIAVAGGQRMVGWLMPSILAVCLLLAGALHLLAARTRHEPSPARTEVPERMRAPATSPPRLGAQNLEGRVFVGPDITPQFLQSLLKAHTEVQAEKLLDIYVGKWMQLSGEVCHVGKFEYGSSTVMFAGQPDKDDPAVMLYFSKVWTERLSVLRLGNNINVIGRIGSVNGLRVRLDDCELV
jgi:hypothetical protein